ncbi:ABC transporter ATP-binding protein [Siminovitchia terrae]|uniref:ABC transporter ATP-binding protein n=1 Tax=Siminovitchia terrae TaxID=1914933 RepID=A0ABQ4KZZ2_SIMTE|nr:ATP-binding cassette domain-containing protein [Siminovitchia terrae]GIN96877.1 ABC transporter ATP-binding protein [Siminovitchia terrae]
MKLLSINQLGVNYHKKEVLKNVSFSLNQGEIVGLVGSNGAGKTTLMKAILKFIPPNSGRITFQTDIKNVGALIEHPGLYPFLTGYEHLELFLAIHSTEQEIQKVVHRLDLNEFINLKIKDYSLGMKQRLGVGMALLNNPQLVILDEPMNGLDPRANKLLRETILTYAKEGTTFLISSHILSELKKIIHRTLLLKNGTIEQDIQMNEVNNEEFEDLLLSYWA